MGFRSVVVRLLMAVIALSLAGCGALHGHSGQVEKRSDGMNHQRDFFVAHKGIEDGYEIIFHVMPEPKGLGFSRTSYHLMVSVQKDGLPVTDLKLFSTVTHPDKQREAATPMMQMGEWYMARYNLGHGRGQHWLTVSFERDGKHYTSGVYYPERPYRE